MLGTDQTYDRWAPRLHETNETREVQSRSTIDQKSNIINQISLYFEK